jgi:hypothetical protein
LGYPVRLLTPARLLCHVEPIHGTLRPMRVGALKSLPVLVAAAALALSSCGEDNAASDPQAPAPMLVLDCGASQPLVTLLDVPGPGRATPEKAVAPYADGLYLIAEQSGGTAVAYSMRGGEVVRQFDTSRHDDGWWPDGYMECTRR